MTDAILFALANLGPELATMLPLMLEQLRPLAAYVLRRLTHQ